MTSVPSTARSARRPRAIPILRRRRGECQGRPGVGSAASRASVSSGEGAGKRGRGPLRGSGRRGTGRATRRTAFGLKDGGGARPWFAWRSSSAARRAVDDPRIEVAYENLPHPMPALQTNGRRRPCHGAGTKDNLLLSASAPGGPSTTTQRSGGSKPASLQTPVIRATSPKASAQSQMDE
jgi:hypothetical protein